MCKKTIWFINVVVLAVALLHTKHTQMVAKRVCFMKDLLIKLVCDYALW